ncbi:MAG: Holliday junction resolvase RuvX [Proteobacteria bacterium]|nr:Holliday junction resolvase RuvX [Pseudomonadota bacterium]
MIYHSKSEFLAALPLQCQRLLGLDLGQRKIGVAVLHLGTRITSPVGVIVRQNKQADLKSLRKLIGQWQAGGVVVGIPLEMDGNPGAAAQGARQFIVDIDKQLKIAVIGHDERLSTAAAHSLMKSLDVKRKARHKADDMLAASLILENFINTMA